MRGVAPTAIRRAGPPSYSQRCFVPPNYSSASRSPYQERKPEFPMYYGRDRPTRPVYSNRPNFVVELRSGRCTFREDDARTLIKKCRSTPEDFRVFRSGLLACSLNFRQWVDALEAMVCFWELRFDGAHDLTPRLVSNVLVPSDTDELTDRLKTLFVGHIRGLLEGEELKSWLRKEEHLVNEISRVSNMPKKFHSPAVFEERNEKKRRLTTELELISQRVEEFRCAMNCILNHLEGNQSPESGEGVKVIKFEGAFDWNKIYHLLMRERSRLDDGLPIYAARLGILQQIHAQQIMVLIGETGSGKSTQLVQFLADSGVAADETIICTQPRKIAAMSLAHRVEEESRGCCKNNSISFCSTYSSFQGFNSKIIFMTDHCLLQHYMNDKNLTGISCIIVDEAHERSLNTDLLLALVKDLLHRRQDLRLIIMSATADASQLSDYFFGCGTYHVLGRNFPVDVRYVPCASEGTSGPGIVASYVADVVRMATEIHRTEKEGTILAFLTSQTEVEWACEKFHGPAAIALPLHGKLSHEDQFRIFQNYPGRRKVIFTTNLAETSLTIPGVKYVIDSGMVKESKFEPGTGMNVLRVCRISQSAANQRAGRAGRTEPGRCYRLYSERDFELMPPHQEPEIRRVHLGVAVLRIFALGIKNVQSFDFVDAPSAKAIDMAVRNLIQLGAVVLKDDVFELTADGRYLVKLGIEPRLGKLILNCFHHRLGKEGLVLAAVMANSSSIFCRVGNDDDKYKSDRLKVQFCHRNGDLFTLLTVYKEWENLPQDRRNGWCWENSINAKSMRRCHDTMNELEQCLKNELNVIMPSYWHWNPYETTEYDKDLKKAVLSSLSENVAMYSGYDHLGYEVALSGQHVQLHPSCSLLIFGQKPCWVVFGEILSISNQYLVCVTGFDFDTLSTLDPPPLFDVSMMGNRKLQGKVMSGFGSTLLKRFCGKSNISLISLVSRVREVCMDDRIGIEVDVDQNEIVLFASSEDMEKVFGLVNDALEYERKLLLNECMEKCLYHGGPGILPSVALFGAGGEIRHLELGKRCLSVDVYLSTVNAVDDKELLMFLEQYASGSICAIQKFTSIGQDSEEVEKWGRITFLTPEAAKKSEELTEVEFSGSVLKVVPSRTPFGGNNKMFSFPAVRARVYWPRRLSKGLAIIKCFLHDVGFMLDDLCDLHIGGKPVRCEVSRRNDDSVVILGIDKELSEAEILDEVKIATQRRILDFFLVRGDAAENLPCASCEEALVREISPFMPKRNPHSNCCRVQVFPPEPKDAFMKAMITFDGRLHLEAAKALEGLEGKVLPGCLSWQKLKCQPVFHSSVSCPASVYFVIKKQLHALVGNFKHQKGVECNIVIRDNGSCFVKISANATKRVAELRRPVEHLMKGRLVDDPILTPTILQHLSTRDGIMLMRSIQQQTGTYIRFDRQSISARVFGSPDKIDVAEQRLVRSLLSLHESRQLEIGLRGGDLPPDLMKEVVTKFGPDLHGLKEKVPEVELTLNTRRQVISIRGNKDMKQKVEGIVYGITHRGDVASSSESNETESTCPICFCEVEEGYRLESCGHTFCQSCLVEQCESAMRNQDSIPMRCVREGCQSLILITDLRSLLPNDKLEDLFRVSLVAFVALSGGTLMFCPTPDCPSIYQVADPAMTAGALFVCGACFAETCTRCHMDYHPDLSCEMYKMFKDDPDSSLKEWSKDREHVKKCPVCGFTIEKVDGCNHIECRCGKHICWVCLEKFDSSDVCYGHLRSVHQAII